MPEEFLWWFEQWSSAEWWSEVSQEDIETYKENIRKSKQTKKAIKDQKKRDKQNAYLLTLLIQTVEDETLLKNAAYQLKEKDIKPAIIAAQFLPLFKEMFDIQPLEKLFETIRSDAQETTTKDPQSLINRFFILFDTYPLLDALEDDKKITLIADFCAYCGHDTLPADWSNDTKNIPIKQRLKQNI